MTREQPDDLPMLLNAVIRARAEVEQARHGRATPGVSAADPQQRSLLAALETYTAALARQGVPVPYRLCRELAMYRSMFNIRRGAGSVD